VVNLIPHSDENSALRDIKQMRMHWSYQDIDAQICEMCSTTWPSRLHQRVFLIHAKLLVVPKRRSSGFPQNLFLILLLCGNLVWLLAYCNNGKRPAALDPPPTHAMIKSRIFTALLFFQCIMDSSRNKVEISQPFHGKDVATTEPNYIMCPTGSLDSMTQSLICRSLGFRFLRSRNDFST